jgi:tRNA(Arg) A34 adenosine deaminase TadA
MNYELFMGEALEEEAGAQPRERPIAAVAVVDDAMVVRAHDRVQETNDPTAPPSSWPSVKPPASSGPSGSPTRRSSRPGPCPMCVGALLASDIDALVYAAANDRYARRGRSSS